MTNCRRGKSLELLVNPRPISFCHLSSVICIRDEPQASRGLSFVISELAAVDRVVENFEIFLDDIRRQLLILQAQIARLQTALRLKV